MCENDDDEIVLQFKVHSVNGKIRSLIKSRKICNVSSK